MVSLYEQAEEGVPFPAVKTGWKHACCDCGLVHRVNFRQTKDGREMLLTFWRDNRATASMRRGMMRRLAGIWRKHG